MIELQQLSQELAQRRAEFALIKEKVSHVCQNLLEWNKIRQETHQSQLAQIYATLLPPRTLVLNRAIAFERIVEEAIRLRSKIQEVIPILLEALDWNTFIFNEEIRKDIDKELRKAIDMIKNDILCQ